MACIEKYQYIQKTDYENIAGPDWPPYDIFITHKNVPEFVYEELDATNIRTQSFSNDTFCVNPFYSRELPKNTPCCIMQRNYNLDQVKKEMLNGVRPSACNACWKIEDAGLESDRQIKNKTLDYWSGNDLEVLIKDAQNNANKEMMYKIDTSNRCNSTCVTCGSMASSSWAKLERKNNLIPFKQWDIKLDKIDIDYKNAKVIGFRGGEPLVSQTNFDILEKLLEEDNVDCFVNFTTNGSVRLTQRQKNILKNFKNISMCFSIDGIGKVFEYMRYPLKWQDCLDNLAWNLDQGIDVSVSYTVSNINILYHCQTTEWFLQQKLPYLFNPVVMPEHFRPSAMSMDLKQKVIECNPVPEVKQWLQSHTENDEKDWCVAIEEIKKQDRWKNISYTNFLPELQQYIK